MFLATSRQSSRAEDQENGQKMDKLVRGDLTSLEVFHQYGAEVRN